ncbi:SusE domain-containing protein [Polaribacter marinaquae]|uniref:SusE domain-containing protein n=1 Tax=Polaribacter marinaquae TaxID=1642819 RepID=A0ABZ2TUR1_9FLAO
MKKIILKSVIALLLLVTYSCEENNSPIFIAQPDVDGIVFTSSFASNYLISEETKDNIADRIIWESADFGVATNITYEIQGSIDPTFVTSEVIGTTNENNYAITVSNLLNFANQLALDDDPNTTDSSGSPNNVGQFFIRIKANAGTANNLETFSEFETINITWIEKVLTNTCDSLYVLGEGITDAGWNFPGIEVTCDTDVLTVKTRLQNGHFRFFTTVGDWNSGQDYSFYKNDGYTIDSKLENAPAGDNFNFVGTPGIYTITIDKNNKTIEVKESSSLWAVGAAVPGGWGFNSDTVEFVENTPNIWSASIALSNDIFRLFQTFDTWDTNNNMTYYEDEGFTIDSNFENDGSGDGNFKFIGTPGTYTMTIDAVNKTITLN